MSTDALVRHALNGPAMGSRWSALFHAPSGIDPARVHAALAAAVEQVEAQMSTWRPQSDLMRLNAAPVGSWHSVPRDLLTVLEAALQTGRASGGAFDIGVGDLVAAWGFGAQAQTLGIAALGANTPPARRARTAGALELDPAHLRVRKTAPLALDLSGIAKGFGVDQLARVLEGFGIGAWLVGIDGEMRARGVKPDGTPWAVALEEPQAGTRTIRAVIALEDCAVATSGDYRHFIDRDGARLSHTIDPTAQAPVRHRVASVTVLAQSCMLADAWATALLVLGDHAGPALARNTGLNALFLLRGANGVSEIAVGPVFGA